MLEASANIFNVLSVMLAARNNVSTWWTGIVGGGLFLVLFYENRLYGDAALQIFFIGSSIVGWRNWCYGGKDKSELPVKTASARLFGLSFVSCVIASAIVGFLLKHYTDASYPYPDAAVLVFSIVAQFFLLARLVASWILWIFVDLIAVPLFFAKGLYLTSTLYAGFFFMACAGLLHWRKIAIK